MDIFSVFTLFGGLAFFLYGMTVMSNGLEKIAGGKFEKALTKVTSNPLKSLLFGAAVTIAIQSSSAMTVMLVGLVNSGIMELGQTVGIIMGSNIGTTLTAWILSLAGISSSNFFVRLLNPKAFSPIVAFAGIILIMVSKNSRKKDLGTVMIGFSVLMFGMQLMSSSVSPLADMPEFSKLMVAFNNPILGVVTGAVFTGIIQSSAASVGILQALALTGGVTYGMAIPIIMGQNIGTCVTALISSIGVNRNAKRVAAVHIYFNLIGTAVLLSLFFILNGIIGFSFINSAITPVAIAGVHSVFNILTTALLLPFGKQLEKLARITVGDEKRAEEYTVLDDRLLATPSVAVSECEKLTKKMASLVKSNLYESLNTIGRYSQKDVDEINVNEEIIDSYEDRLGTYLVKISGKEISDRDSKEVSKILHVIGDFERIGDHAVNITEVAQEIKDKEVKFSKQGRRDMEIITNALKEVVETTMHAFENNDIESAKTIEPLEEVIDLLQEELKKRHIDRLKQGKCTIEQGFVFNDLLTNYERISDHCSNIAVCLIQVNESSFDTHEYMIELKRADNANFNDQYKAYKRKYSLDKIN